MTADFDCIVVGGGHAGAAKDFLNNLRGGFQGSSGTVTQNGNKRNIRENLLHQVFRSFLELVGSNRQKNSTGMEVR